jgi:hypothetical protein
MIPTKQWHHRIGRYFRYSLDAHVFTTYSRPLDTPHVTSAFGLLAWILIVTSSTSGVPLFAHHSTLLCFTLLCSTMSIFRKPLECYFCGTPCPTARLSSPSSHGSAAGRAGCSFRCVECGSFNRYDSKGQIMSDEPAMHDEAMNARSFARRGMYIVLFPLWITTDNIVHGSIPTEEPSPIRVHILLQHVLPELQDQPNVAHQPPSIFPPRALRPAVPAASCTVARLRTVPSGPLSSSLYELRR